MSVFIDNPAQQFQVNCAWWALLMGKSAQNQKAAARVMAVKERIYFDYNASAPLLDCARDAMFAVMDSAGNPSSVHNEGRAARKHVEAARRSLAALLQANPANVIFTSGATEAASHALSPHIRVGGKEVRLSRVYVGATEHPCVLGGGRFSSGQISFLPVDGRGLLDLQALEEALENKDAADGPFMVAVQLANSETGVIQPLCDVAEIVHRHSGFLLVDAVQGLGKHDFTLSETGADFLIVSSHKIGGPQGAGALVLANGDTSPLPLLTGGGQESYHRAGTENVAAIAGFGAACDWHRLNRTKNIHNNTLRDSIEARLGTISLEAGNGVAQPVFFGDSAPRLGNTSCFSVEGIKAETALVGLDLEGISVSSGSACSSGKVKQSHVLAAMGADTQAMAGALRISIGWNSTEEEASRFLDAWKTIIGRKAA